MIPSAVLQACALPGLSVHCRQPLGRACNNQNRLKSSILRGPLLCNELLFSGARLSCQADQQGADMVALGSHRGTRISYDNLHSIGNIETD
jgi:hypothetical protein